MRYIFNKKRVGERLLETDFGKGDEVDVTAVSFCRAFLILINNA